ncbi:helix-turn-helix domain-containing protein [Natronobiforma cellulositropha]|uniref:helix-turn-helix domain-containing protein n=1 Tax=Natronobiforma cellulositropha TaxID=1679076 RepID=UPI0021D60C26|nr:helix-turn-helix domain-containing protein [Natronobiforma cellulositropha]
MSVIASVTIPADEFPLGSLLESDTASTVSVESTVPTDESVIPYLWIPERATDGALEELGRVDVVTDAAVIDEVDGHTLVHLEWASEVNGFLESVRETTAIVTGAAATAEQWTFRLRFPAYEGLSAFYTRCLEQDISVELVQIHEAIGPENRPRFGLTEAQRELVLAAYEDGYFDVPRQTTLVDLGEKLEVSDSAVSQRLRRGLASLIHSTVVIGESADTDVPK